MRNPLSPISLSKRCQLLGIVCLPLAFSGGLSAEIEATTLDKVVAEKQATVDEAKGLMMKGDVLLTKGDYVAAMQSFRRSVSLVSFLPKKNATRQALSKRYASAAVEYGKVLVKAGDLVTAQALMDDVLSEEVLPKHAKALAFRANLADPARTNPAVTLEHLDKVGKVSDLLAKARGFINLGDYDQAEKTYFQVLRFDGYNKAAARGLEEVNDYRADYARAGQDQTRSALLADVESGWELKINPDSEFTTIDADGGFLPSTVKSLESRLNELVIKQVSLEEVTLAEAIDFLREESINLDKRDVPESQKGLNFSRVLTTEEESHLLSITARFLPMRAFLDYITQESGTKWAVGDYSISITSPEKEGAVFESRTWSVPPDFLSRGAAPQEEEELDIFDSEKKNKGLSAIKITAKDYLIQNGVPFPDGASASLTSGSQLRVRNTRYNLGLIDQLVEGVNSEEPVNLVYRTTIIEVTEEVVNEFGIDWLVGSGSFDDSGKFFGSGGTTGNGSFEAVDGSGLTPITSGLRSGNFAISGNSIDNLLARGEEGPSAGLQRAPGFLQFSYLGRQQFSALLRGLNNKKGVDVAARMSAVGRPDSKALVESVREIIYPTAYEAPEIPNSSGLGNGNNVNNFVGGSQAITPITPSTPSEFATRKIGAVMEVEGSLSQDRRYISLNVSTGITTFDGFVNYGTPIIGGSTDVGIDIEFNTDPFGPLFNIFGLTSSSISGEITDNRILLPLFTEKRVDTNVTIEDGATIAIGGLKRSQRELIEDSVPILSDLPLVGGLFEYSADRRFKSHFVVFVTVEVQDPSGAAVNAK